MSIWQKRISPDNDALFATSTHDFVVCYAQNINLCKFYRFSRTEEADARYENPDNDPRGVWTSSDLTRREYREHDFYPIELPSGRTVTPSAGRSWSVPKSTFQELLKNNQIWFGRNGDAMPRRKRFLTEVSDGIVPTTWWTKDFFGDNQSAKREVKSFFPEVDDIFATPKPSLLIKRILQIATDPDSIILDSFAGSGTTAHAVMQLNREDGGARRAILVEMEPTIAQSITAERLRRVAGGYTDAKNKHVEGLGGGFRYVRLGTSLFDESGNIAPDVRFTELARYVFFYETGVPLGETSVADAAQTQVNTPLLGVASGKAVYLLYNGILKDKTPHGGNVLTRETVGFLAMPPLGKDEEPPERIVYGTSCRLSPQTLSAESIVFKQIPYSLHV